MSDKNIAVLKGAVGSHQVEFLNYPNASSGVVPILINGKELNVSYKRDQSGIWLSFGDRTIGFDVSCDVSDSGQELFHLSSRNTGDEYENLTWIREGDQNLQKAGANKKGIKVKAQMPGKILKVMVKTGDVLRAGDPILVMEAMKMENEIKSPSAGIVSKLLVVEGQTVETGFEMLSLKPEGEV